ncbi:amidase [Dinoroseobacter sp. S76]|uniref:amidase n=1 Tax=Dinoroseobacter sp. S76 TaxID=3415124 RepID=UPI003C7EB3E0
MHKDWLTQSAAEQGRAIGEGTLDPVALTEAYLDAIAAAAESPRIYARTTPERALSEAVAAHDRAKSQSRLGLLDGVPISWKDLFDTAGSGTEAGSALLAGRVPSRDAEVLRNATAAGLVCLGKTHMSELAFSGLGLNPMTATPPCVNDPDAVPGGSSSGAASSVAFGLAAAGMGSDTGGSVRIPSAWNDLVGLKTTSGLLSLEGVVPLAASFDTVGPLCRTVEDTALFLGALGGVKAPDLRGARIKGAKLAILRSVAFEDIRPEPLAAFDAAVAKLADAGAEITEITADEVPTAMALSGALFATEGYGYWKDVIEAAPEKMFPPILERFRGGKEVDAPSYVAAWNELRALRAIWAARTREFDGVLVPTAPILPPDAGRLMTDDAYYVQENLMALRNTRIGNLMGLCALTLPTGMPSCGISIMGQPFGEAALLRLGKAAEAALA